MKNLAISNHFQKEFRKLSSVDQEKVREALKKLLHALKSGHMPAELGFKKINGDKYEIRVDLKTRIAIKSEGDTLVCHLIGSHNDIKRYLKEYLSK